MATIKLRLGFLRGFPSRITFGSNGDSYYEYLLKQWLLTDKTDDNLKHQYELAIDSMISKMLGRSKPSGWMFLGELSYLGLKPQMEHLTCFVPGMLALGFLHGMPFKHLEIAQELMETCVKMYTEMATGLAPELVHFHTDQSTKQVEEKEQYFYRESQQKQQKQQQEKDMYVLSTNDYNLLRPEVVESLFILYQVTKDKKYQQYGRQIMEAFEKNSRVDTGGYRNTAHVFKGPMRSCENQKKRSMQSFFLAETLKYFYLLFADKELFSLKEMVFNTEAHPFPITIHGQS
jgi:mannosyl-oligosaccharide alpha-1,2-mannosidase